MIVGVVFIIMVKLNVNHMSVRMPIRQLDMGELVNSRSKHGDVFLQAPRTDKFIKGPGWWDKGRG